ncbi:GDP-mannose 4,6-dehydratase [Candidatus Woesearchaeota archaeon]|nr:GDP-mannose 4,6-dehydratase [Candidatus Woesearchaeota archaeon]|tara:strand:+ start:3506 stop:4423 length:918 start_codon:yes stop_codon:yes gene_type:complete
MKAFITGINGFVGRYLAKYLLEKGFEVTGIDRNSVEVKGCDVEECDILDKEKVELLIEKIKPDVIFHLAALSSVKQSFSNPEDTKKVSIEGTKNLFDAVIEANINPVILVISSLQVYGAPDKVPITEDSELRPASPYAEAKVEQEKLCKEYFKKGLKIIITRSFNHTGPEQSEEFVWPSFAKQIAEIETGKRKEIKVGNLSVKRDFSDVRDIVRAYLLAVEKCEPGETYNICSGKAYNIGEMLDILKSYSTTDIQVIVEPSRLRKIDVPLLYGNNSKFFKATGWKPEIPFEQTLKDILEYWRKRV